MPFAGELGRRAVVASTIEQGVAETDQRLAALLGRPVARSAFNEATAGSTVMGHCQNNCTWPTLDEEVERLCGTELAPLGESGGTVQLEIFAAVEMALLIEMIVYG